MTHSRTSIVVALAAAAVAALPAHSHAQVHPERTYYGKDRPVPVTVDLSEQGAEGAAIVLYAPGGAEVARADVSEGRADLAALFPRLWEADEPRLLYAQLEAGGEGVGPALVLQPTTSPVQWMLSDPRMPPVARPGPSVYSGIRAWPEQDVVLETDRGEMRFRLRPDEASNTAWNFMHLVEGGYYTDIVFHRIIGTAQGDPGFMVQVGDPTGTGAGGPGYFIDFEGSELPHDFGVLSMARSTDPNTAGGQIFICLSRERTAPLDSRYVSFGELIEGEQTLEKLGATPVEGNETGEMSKPIDAPRVISAKLVDAAPFDRRPPSVTERRAAGEGDARQR